MSTLKKILIIAGGTGGHIFPALAVADELQKQGVIVEWMGTTFGMEKKLVGNRYPIHYLRVKTFRENNLVEKCLLPVRLLSAVFSAYRIIKKINPDVVLGMGGYASGPGGITAWLARKKLVIHEQNAHAGFTNRVLSRFASVTLEAFPDSFSKNTKVITVGNPVRAAIQKIAHPKAYFANREMPWRILVLGGSQGAHFINQLLMDFVSANTNRQAFLLWHQTGAKEYEKVKAAYAQYEAFPHRVAPFIEKMDEAYAWADIVIGRAGALTVSEIAVVGLPSILIPYPYATDDHQYKNALFLQKNKAAFIFRQQDLTVEKLTACLQNNFFSQKQLQMLSTNAKRSAVADATANIIRSLSA